MNEQPQPQALLVGDAPSPFMLIHDFENVWQVVRANRSGDAKLIRTIRHGLERRTNLNVTCKVSTQALIPSNDGFGNPTLEVSGKGFFQLLMAWSMAFGFYDNLSPSRILKDWMGLQTAEQWMTGTLVFLLRDQRNLLKGDIPVEAPDDYGHYQAQREWRENADFWAKALA